LDSSEASTANGSACVIVEVLLGLIHSTGTNSPIQRACASRNSSANSRTDRANNFSSSAHLRAHHPFLCNYPIPNCRILAILVAGHFCIIVFFVAHILRRAISTFVFHLINWKGINHLLLSVIGGFVAFCPLLLASTQTPWTRSYYLDPALLALAEASIEVAQRPHLRLPNSKTSIK
jgi:hypothetical protein